MMDGIQQWHDRTNKGMINVIVSKASTFTSIYARINHALNRNRDTVYFFSLFELLKKEQQNEDQPIYFTI